MYGTKRTVTLNIDTQKAVNPASEEKAFSEDTYYGTKYIYNADIQDDAEVATDLASWQFRFSLSNAFDHDAPINNLVESSDSQFNIPGDRSDLDVSTGKISWRADFYTSELADAYTSTSDSLLNVQGELWGLPPGETAYVLIAQWDIDCYNTVGSVAGGAPSGALTYVSVDELNTRIEDGVILTIDTDGKMVVTVDGTERARI